MSVVDELIESKVIDFMNVITSFAVGSDDIDNVKADPFWPWPFV
ncbi:MAG: hypothetical protein ACTSX4_04090 [Candidatus Helarchaeota archaeon]